MRKLNQHANILHRKTIVPTVFSFKSLSVCVLFSLFFSFIDFISFGFHVVELVKRRMAVRSARKSNERISPLDFFEVNGWKRFLKYPLMLYGALKSIPAHEGRFE